MLRRPTRSLVLLMAVGWLGCSAASPPAATRAAPPPAQPPTPNVVVSETPERIRARERCEAGDFEACHDYGVMLARGTGGEQDLRRAVTQYIGPACERGRLPSSCGLYGQFLIEVEHEPARGILLIEQSCEAGYDIGCSSLGVHLLEGIVIERDVERGMHLLRRSCQRGSRVACNHLGRLSTEDAPPP